MKRITILCILLLCLSVASRAFAAMPQALKATDIFLFGTTSFDTKAYEKSHATMVVNAELYGSSDNDKKAFEFNAKIFHQRGLKLIIWASIFDYQGNDFDQQTDLQNAICKDIDGNKIKFDLMGGYWQCINQKAWRDSILARTKEEIRLGADGITFDECNANASVVDGKNGCFCDACMQGFREYLAEKYSKAELKNLGILNIDTFDYGKYITEKKLVKLYKNSNSRYEGKVPLYKDFCDFQTVSVKNFYDSMTKELREYGHSLGKEIIISGNVANLRPKSIFMADNFDYLSPEINFGLPRAFRGAAYYKLGESLGKPVYSYPNSAENTELMLRTDATNIMKLYTAEAYTYGGWLNVPYGVRYFDLTAPVGKNGYPEKPINIDMDELGKYYDFIHDNQLLYNSTVSIADTAVVYSYSSGMDTKKQGISEESFYSTCDLLTNSNIPYDVVFAGDGGLIKDQWTVKTLEQYKTVILPSQVSLSEKQAGILQSFKKAGGNVITVENKARRLQNGNTLKKADLKKLSLKMVSTSADQNLIVNRRYEPKENFEILHLLNYNYDDKKMKLLPYKNTKISMQIDKNLIGKKLAVFVVSPDSEGIQELKSTVLKDRITFTVPSLNYYSIAVIGEKDKYKDIKGGEKAEPEPLTSFDIDGKTDDWAKVKELDRTSLGLAEGGIKKAYCAIDDNYLYVAYSQDQKVSHTSIWISTDDRKEKDYFAMILTMDGTLNAGLYQSKDYLPDFIEDIKVAEDDMTELRIPLKSFHYSNKLSIKFEVEDKNLPNPKTMQNWIIVTE